MADRVIRPSKPPKDCMGNEILVDTFVNVVAGFPICWKVLAVDNGGIQTPEGTTLAVVRLVADITLRQAPGLPFHGLIRVVRPDQEKIIESIADLLAKSKNRS